MILNLSRYGIFLPCQYLFTFCILLNKTITSLWPSSTKSRPGKCEMWLKWIFIGIYRFCSSISGYGLYILLWNTFKILPRHRCISINRQFTLSMENSFAGKRSWSLSYLEPDDISVCATSFKKYICCAKKVYDVLISIKNLIFIFFIRRMTFIPPLSGLRTGSLHWSCSHLIAHFKRTT